jgi:hypothetical protein
MSHNSKYYNKKILKKDAFKHRKLVAFEFKKKFLTQSPELAEESAPECSRPNISESNRTSHDDAATESACSSLMELECIVQSEGVVESECIMILWKKHSICSKTKRKEDYCCELRN